MIGVEASSGSAGAGPDGPGRRPCRAAPGRADRVPRRRPGPSRRPSAGLLPAMAPAAWACAARASSRTLLGVASAAGEFAGSGSATARAASATPSGRDQRGEVVRDLLPSRPCRPSGPSRPAFGDPSAFSAIACWRAASAFAWSRRRGVLRRVRDGRRAAGSAGACAQGGDRLRRPRSGRRRSGRGRGARRGAGPAARPARRRAERPRRPASFCGASVGSAARASAIAFCACDLRRASSRGVRLVQALCGLRQRGGLLAGGSASVSAPGQRLDGLRRVLPGLRGVGRVLGGGLRGAFGLADGLGLLGHGVGRREVSQGRRDPPHLVGRGRASGCGAGFSIALRSAASSSARSSAGSGRASSARAVRAPRWRRASRRAAPARSCSHAVGVLRQVGRSRRLDGDRELPLAVAVAAADEQAIRPLLQRRPPRGPGRGRRRGDC